MIYTERYYTKNNVETLEYSRERGYFFYRLQVIHQKTALQSGGYLPMRLKLFLSLFESKSCVIDAISGFSSEKVRLTVLCSSYEPPEKFAVLLRKVVPAVIVEQLTSGNAYRFLEQQMEMNVTDQNDVQHHSHAAIVSAKELLLALLLEYRGLISETGISQKDGINILAQSGVAPGKPFYTPFLFYEKDGMLTAIPSFMVLRLEPEESGYSLIINDLWHGGKESATGVYYCKNIDITSLHFCERKERGYYRALTQTQEFIICIPSLRSFSCHSEETSDYSTQLKNAVSQ